MKINLRLDTAQTKKQGHPLVLTIYVSDNDKIKSYTGYYATADTWDFNKEEPNKKHPLRIGIIDFLLEKRVKIHKLLNSNDRLTAKQIYDNLYGKDDDFIAFWEGYIKELKKVGRDGYATFYENNLNVIRKYKSEIKFSDIDYNFLNEFKSEKRKTCNNGGINAYLKSMRAIYNEGIKRGIFMPKSYLSPFKGIMEKSAPTKDKDLSLTEMKLITSAEKKHLKYDYFILMFLLGGLDFVDITNLKKEHIRNGRVKFVRFKGGTNEIINNKIFPEAQGILDKYESESDYLLPIYQFAYKPYRDKFTRDFRKWAEGIGVKSYFSSKSARYTFINIGKELLLNRDVIMELTGHSRGDVHSIYEGKFSNAIKDEVHRKIIDAVF